MKQILSTFSNAAQRIVVKTSLLSTAVVFSSLSLAQDQAGFEQCLNRLQPAAQSAGVRADVYRGLTAGTQADFAILEKLDDQPEFKKAIWDYMSVLVDSERVAQGKERLASYAKYFDAAQSRYGVDAATVAAVWGVESNYGQNFGKYPLVQALGTLACYGRRQEYFRKEFFAALRILQAGNIAPEKLKGSWAGAFGHTQFMPSTFERLAVDMDGDGRKDLIDSAADAIGSTANFLDKAGWVSGLPWGFEVKLPAGFDASMSGRKNKRSLANWASLGLRLVNGQALTEKGIDQNTAAGLLLLAGVNGPAFLTTKNFDALYSYNAAESYGLAIATLSDRLRGGGPLVTPWPTDDPGLSRAEQREIQTLLIARGYNIGEVDGALGELSRQAIRQEQQRLSMEPSGRAGQKLLQILRAKK